jgi:hypothetical protein
MSTTYHPQTDRQTEQVNQLLEQYLRIFCNQQQEDWVRLLPTAEFSYNNAPHESTKMSPFFVEYGQNPRMAPDVLGELSHPSLEDLFENRIEAQEQTKAALVLAAEQMKWYHNLLHTDPNLHNKPLFSVGQKVLVKGTDLRVKVKSPKLAAKNYGPYKIIEQFGPVTFKLKLPKAMKVHPVYHASKFIPYHEDTIAGCKPTEPPPIEVKGYDEFEVEEILDSATKHNKIQYLVK